MLPTAKKGFYHSELVQETQNGPIWICFTGEGKITIDGQKDPFAPCKVHEQPYVKDGQEQDRYYNIENAAIRAHLDRLTSGQWYAVQAFGSRDSATLQIKDAQGAEIPAPQAAVGPPASAPATTQAGPGMPPAQKQNGPGWGSAPAPAANGAAPKTDIDILMGRCMKSAAFLVNQVCHHAGIAPTDEAVLQSIHAAAATLFIQASRSGGASFAYDSASIGSAKPGPVEGMAEGAKQEPAGVGAGQPSPFEDDDDSLPF